jgi:hypothetical protein
VASDEESRRRYGGHLVLRFEWRKNKTGGASFETPPVKA